MSRLARKKIMFPSGVSADFSGGVMTVKGPQGALKRSMKDEISANIETDGVTLNQPVELNPETKSLLGTYASHLRNMVTGVAKGFEKKLIMEGIGYKVNLAGQKLNFSLGLSHPVEVAIPEGIKVVIDKNNITISGIDKELVGSFAARLRDLKRPEPYKGKGIRYSDEVVRRKEGKKVVS